MIENRQDVNFNFVGKTQFKEGYDLTRLVSPSIEQVNDDFLCAICQSKFFSYLNIRIFFVEIVNAPVECDNSECGQLYCSYCLNMKLIDKNLQ